MASVSLGPIQFTKDYQTPPLSTQLDKLYDQLDRPGNRLTLAQFYQTPEYQALLQGYYGSLNAYVPPGAEITNQSANQLTYRDAEGYLHTLTRDVAGGANASGQITESTNRPAILPSGTEKQQASALQDVLTKLTSSLGTASTSTPSPSLSGLVPIDAQTQALLKQISDAENARLTDQFNKAQGTAVAQLVGNGVGASSIAGQIMNQLLQGQGLVQQQASSDQANRQLTLQQVLTQLAENQRQYNNSYSQNSLQQALSYFNSLLNDQTQKQLANAGLNLDYAKLFSANQQNQIQNRFNQTNQQYQLQQDQAAKNNFDIVPIINTALSAISGLQNLGVFGGSGAGAAKAASTAPAAINTIGNIPNTLNFKSTFNPFI